MRSVPSALLPLGFLIGILGAAPGAEAATIKISVSSPTPIVAPEESTPTATPTPKPSPKTVEPQDFPSESPDKETELNHVLTLHKPVVPPEWGRVLQYHREIATTNSLFEREKETIHEFVLQSSKGVIRNAFYHEPASGNGFWVVWVWDQP